jgi:hypothetical protein
VPGAFDKSLHSIAYQHRAAFLHFSRPRIRTTEPDGDRVSASVHPHGRIELWTRRKPRLLLRLPGSFLLRLAERQFDALLFQLPPRLTRLVPSGRRPKDIVAEISMCAP